MVAVTLMTKEDKLIGFGESIKNAGGNLVDALGDVAEVGLDALTKTPDAWESLPGVKIVAGLYKASVSVKQSLDLRKLQDFLTSAAKASGASELKKEEVMRHFGGEKNRQRLGETIILLLDRADDMQKPAIQGRIMGELMTGKLSYRMAMSLSAILDRVVMDDLETLTKANPSFLAFDNNNDDFSALHRLQANGLMYQSVIDAGDFEGNSTQEFSLTAAGEQMARIYRTHLEDCGSENG
jgi:hypothetical protein